MKKVRLLDLPLIRRLGGVYQEFDKSAADELIKNGRAEEINDTIPTKAEILQEKVKQVFVPESKYIFPNELIAMEG